MTSGIPIRGRRAWLGAAGGFALAGLLAPGAALAQKPAEAPPRVATEKHGAFAVREGGRLKLVTDMGNVRVYTRPGAGDATFRVRIEADASQPDAETLVEQFKVSASGTPESVSITGTVPWKNFRGRLLVNYEVRLPQRFQVEITTAAGNIRLDEIEGAVTLNSAGGNLVAAGIGGAARLETRGGHITVQDVGGSLTAITQGGHVNAGQVAGDAMLKSAGGHISVNSVQGTAQLETQGGNISLQRGGASVIATTLGGRIDVGEAAGSVRAHTAGGGIRVVRLAGPTQLQTNGGSIYLTSIQGAVRAATAAGGITAWIPAAVRLQGASQLESSHGDILVYIPREQAITIEASIEGGGDHRIDAPDDVPLKIVSGGTPGSRRLRAEVALNGGGEVLRLRALHGNIRLRFSDDFQALYERIYKAQMEAFAKGRQWDQRMLEFQLRQQEQKQREKERPREQETESEPRERRGRWEEWSLLFRERISGSIPVNADQQQKKLLQEVRPQYPDAAKKAGVEGIVWLEAMIDREGKVEQVNVISGHPLLAQAAVEAVRQWRYAPTYVGERPVAVTTVIRLAFRLE